MISNKLRVLSLVLMAVMVFSFLTACIEKSPEPTETTKQQSVTTAATTSEPATTEPEGPTVLKLYNVRLRHDDVSADNLIIKEIERRTNTILEITLAPPDEAEQKLTLALSSGERPDIITFGSSETEFNLAKSGLLLSISDYFDKMPNLKNSRPDFVWEAMKHPDGKIYAVPSSTDAPATYVTVYRKDWLDKFGLAVPTTLDQYYEVADAISNRDPDGDNVKDTYALGGRGSLGSYFDHIWSAFGFMPNYWIEVDGKLEPGDIMPVAKDAIAFCKRMYDNGMIDPEFTTDSSSRYREKVNQGMFGAWHYGAYIIDTENIYNNYEPFMQNNPEAVLVAGPLLEGPGGKFGYRQDISPRGWILDAIISETKELDACLRFIDFLASDEGVMLMNYGIEGEHYAMDAKGIVRDLVKDADKTKFLGINELVMCSKSTFYQTSQPFKDAMKMAMDNSVPNPFSLMSNPEISELYGVVKDILYAEYFRMISGETPIDGGFEDFVRQWKSSGGDRLIELVNQEYQKMK